MQRIETLERYKDERGNEIVYDGTTPAKIDIRFGTGSNNRVVIAADADLRSLLVMFTGSNGHVDVSRTTKKRAGLRFELRVGHDSTVRIAENVGCAGAVFISASEGEDVTIGADVMFAKGIEVRTDDTHAIYDVRTGDRVNVSRSITVGEHVWLAKHATVMGGVSIGNGSVIGFRSIVTSSVPNNCVAAGVPARVVRRDIAWERPETPYQRPDEVWPKPGQKSEEYWNLTDDDAPLPGAGTAVGPKESAPRPAKVAPVAAVKKPGPLAVKAARVKAGIRRRLY